MAYWVEHQPGKLPEIDCGFECSLAFFLGKEQGTACIHIAVLHVHTCTCKGIGSRYKDYLKPRLKIDWNEAWVAL